MGEREATAGGTRPKNHALMRLARSYLGSYRRYLIAGPAAKLLEVVFDLLVPLIIARMIDDGVNKGDTQVILHLGVLLCLMAVAGLAATLVCQKMAALTSQGAGTDLRRDLYARINELSFADLDRFGTPTLITRITNDVNQLQVACALLVRQVIRWPFLAIGSMVCALAIDLRLGLVFLVVTPLIGLVFYLVMSRCVPYFRAMQAKLDRVATICRENLSGARVVRAFVREDHESSRFREAATEQAATAVAAGRLSALLNPATLAIMDLGVIAILWAGGIQVDTGELTQGQVMAFVNYMTQTLLAIVYVANLVVVFTKGAASAERVSEVLDCVPGMVDGPGCQPCDDTSEPALELDDVSFTYDGSRAPALSKVSCRIGVGETLGIIGGTGSGKSTLGELVPRLYEATEGRVSVLGNEVGTWRLDDLRNLVSIVPQDCSLVSGTIRSNLLWRDDAATDDELWAALDVAQASGFVRARPEGLDAPVEAMGRNLSGGQRQRITIARALIGSPRILVLDDASSALDYATEAALRQSLAEFDKDLTTIVISQRISAVASADVILVLDDGRQVGIGTNDELEGSCAVYDEIIGTQRLREGVRP